MASINFSRPLVRGLFGMLWMSVMSDKGQKALLSRSFSFIPTKHPHSPLHHPPPQQHLFNMSFIETKPDSDFSIHNIPFGIISTAENVS